MAGVIIYHNGRCSKSRDALAILIAKSIPHEIRWYLTDLLTRKELKALLRKLDMSAFDLVRKSEHTYKETYKDKELSEEEWLTVLVNNPTLIERPIVEKDGRAIVARPTERLFEVIS